MDFQSLARKELQALCKKNKIPANLTNTAMADSLSALEVVEGLEELSEQTDVTSLKTPGKPMVTSNVTHTSTRRRTAAKEVPESGKLTTKTRRSAKPAEKETPAPENVEESKKDGAEAKVELESVKLTTRTRRGAKPAEKETSAPEDDEIKNEGPKAKAEPESVKQTTRARRGANPAEKVTEAPAKAEPESGKMVTRTRRATRSVVKVTENAGKKDGAETPASSGNARRAPLARSTQVKAGASQVADKSKRTVGNVRTTRRSTRLVENKTELRNEEKENLGGTEVSMEKELQRGFSDNMEHSCDIVIPDETLAVREEATMEQVDAGQVLGVHIENSTEVDEENKVPPGDETEAGKEAMEEQEEAGEVLRKPMDESLDNEKETEAVEENSFEAAEENKTSPEAGKETMGEHEDEDLAQQMDDSLNNTKEKLCHTEAAVEEIKAIPGDEVEARKEAGEILGQQMDEPLDNEKEVANCGDDMEMNTEGVAEVQADQKTCAVDEAVDIEVAKELHHYYPELVQGQNDHESSEDDDHETKTNDTMLDINEDEQVNKTEDTDVAKELGEDPELVPGQKDEESLDDANDTVPEINEDDQANKAEDIDAAMEGHEIPELVSGQKDDESLDSKTELNDSVPEDDEQVKMDVELQKGFTDNTDMFAAENAVVHQAVEDVKETVDQKFNDSSCNEKESVDGLLENEEDFSDEVMENKFIDSFLNEKEDEGDCTDEEIAEETFSEKEASQGFVTTSVTLNEPLGELGSLLDDVQPVNEEAKKLDDGVVDAPSDMTPTKEIAVDGLSGLGLAGGNHVADSTLIAEEESVKLPSESAMGLGDEGGLIPQNVQSNSFMMSAPEFADGEDYSFVSDSEDLDKPNLDRTELREAGAEEKKSVKEGADMQSEKATNELDQTAVMMSEEVSSKSSIKKSGSAIPAKFLSDNKENVSAIPQMMNVKAPAGPLETMSLNQLKEMMNGKNPAVFGTPLENKSLNKLKKLFKERVQQAADKKQALGTRVENCMDQGESAAR